MNNSVVIVIPIHLEFPSEYELISFQQCFKILYNYPIKIIAPQGLNLKEYRKYVPNLDVLYIPPKWQSSIEMYNKLKLSKYFYSLFTEFNFLLTYELDAFVFKDDLIYWCNKGYDYIGAPWFQGFDNPISNNFEGVGNSGFSLRKIQSMKNGLDIVYTKSGASFKKNKFLTLYNKIFLLSSINKLKENPIIQNSINMKEDWFISKVIARNCPKFKIAPIEDAIKFSFEVNPNELYKINNFQLPMGCHAWHRYNIEFWKPFIEKEGYFINK